MYKNNYYYKKTKKARKRYQNLYEEEKDKEKKMCNKNLSEEEKKKLAQCIKNDCLAHNK